MSNLFNQVINPNDIVKQLYDSCIKTKHTKIVRYKKMTSITQNLQQILVNLWRSNDPPSLSQIMNLILLLDIFTFKSWVLLFRSKKEFFDAFRLWLLYAKKVEKEKFGCLQSDSGREVISISLKGFGNEKGITIDYVNLYIYKKRYSQTMLKEFSYNKRLISY